MEKLKLLFTLTNILMSLSSLSGCSMYYDFGEDIGIFCSGYNVKTNESFLYGITWNDGDSMDIVCPDYANNYPVTELGGYIGRGYPCPFCVDIIDYHSFTEDNGPIYTGLKWEDEDFLSKAPVTVLTFNITLPSYLKKLVYLDCQYLLYTEDFETNTITEIIKPIYNLTISSDNQYFYTENGKLYNKKTNKLIDDFLYE